MRHKSVLVLGEHGIALSNLAEQARRLGFRVARARNFEDAISVAGRRNFRYGAALLDPYMPIGNLWEAIRELRVRTRSHDLTPIAVGPEPEPAIREWLRDSDVHLALWEPVGENALRFHLNRAMSNYREDVQRGATRAPAEWPVRVFVGGREKPASLYSISGEGAFLVTWRPSVTGASIALEVPLPEGPVTLSGSVVYTNVPGNLQCSLLPLGMAIEFDDANPQDATSTLEQSISNSIARYAV